MPAGGGRKPSIDKVVVPTTNKRKRGCVEVTAPLWSTDNGKHKVSARAILAHPECRTLDAPCAACKIYNEECVVAPGYPDCASCTAGGAVEMSNCGFGLAGSFHTRGSASLSASELVRIPFVLPLWTLLITAFLRSGYRKSSYRNQEAERTESELSAGRSVTALSEGRSSPLRRPVKAELSRPPSLELLPDPLNPPRKLLEPLPQPTKQLADATFHFYLSDWELGAIPKPAYSCRDSTIFFQEAQAAWLVVGREVPLVAVSATIGWGRPMVIRWGDEEGFQSFLKKVSIFTQAKENSIYGRDVEIKCISKR